ncbi:hypothetical protein [Fibrobacter sp. UBA4309]|nr:hypothetical protein [Fibrobacter sp. UBA4309]
MDSLYLREIYKRGASTDVARLPLARTSSLLQESEFAKARE